MSKTIGIIDCGTNTFNLLIAEPTEEGKLKILFKNKIPVKLAPSATTGVIGKNRFARGIDALFVHKNALINMGVSQIFAFATSAIRDSANGQEFVDIAREKVGLDLKIISGEEEAKLIYEGVVHTIPDDFGRFLIMDIGGGSVEFIIGSPSQLLWLESVDLGVSRLKGEVQPEDPLSDAQILEIKDTISKRIGGLFGKMEEFQVDVLIGSSGSFDSIEKMIGTQSQGGQGKTEDLNELNLAEVRKLHANLLKSTLAQRLSMKGLIPMRADMIVMAMILIDEVVSNGNIKQIYHSENALKEGAFYKLLATPSDLE